MEIHRQPADSRAIPGSPDISGPVTILAILAKLEVSVVASQKAVLALDLSEIEQRTREQIELTRELSALLGGAQLIADAGTACGPSHAPVFSPTCELQKELRKRAVHVRDAVRLQLALLARAQRKLRALANALAGPATAYVSIVPMEHTVLARRIELANTPRQRTGKFDPCLA
jgi:hypothetical protein